MGNSAEGGLVLKRVWGVPPGFFFLSWGKGAGVLSFFALTKGGGGGDIKKRGVGRTPLNDSRLLRNQFLLRCLALLLLVLGSEFLSTCLRQLLGVHAIPLGGIRQRILFVASEALVCGIEQADFQQQAAERTFIVGTDALH